MVKQTTLFILRTFFLGIFVIFHIILVTNLNSDEGKKDPLIALKAESYDTIKDASKEKKADKKKPSIFDRFPDADLAVELNSESGKEIKILIFEAEKFQKLSLAHKEVLLNTIQKEQKLNILYFYKLSSDVRSLVFVGF
jgi:hypothetical protein